VLDVVIGGRVVACIGVDDNGGNMVVVMVVGIGITVVETEGGPGGIRFSGRHTPIQNWLAHCQSL
jgi:hypothetical protein